MPNTNGGYCMCGCASAEKTRIATRTDKTKGQVKGEHLRYLHLHHNRMSGKTRAVGAEQARKEGWWQPNECNGFCYCGCGDKTPIAKATRRSRNQLAGYHTLFIHGHNATGRTGPAHYSWQGGRKRTGGGYIAVWVPDHPNARHDGYVAEHRYVMEQHLGRYLTSAETVHHRNGQRADNRIENLELRVGPHGCGATHCWNCGVDLTGEIDGLV